MGTDARRGKQLLNHTALLNHMALLNHTTTVGITDTDARRGKQLLNHTALLNHMALLNHTTTVGITADARRGKLLLPVLLYILLVLRLTHGCTMEMDTTEDFWGRNTRYEEDSFWSSSAITMLACFMEQIQMTKLTKLQNYKITKLQN